MLPAMAKPTPKPDLPERRLALRLDAALYEAVRATADDEVRTMNATATLLLREALAARGVVVPPPKRKR